MVDHDDRENGRAATPPRPTVGAAEGPGEGPTGLEAPDGSPPPPPDPAQALAEKAQEVERLTDRLLRLQAEFENSKKRMARERAEFVKFATEGLILEFLPVLDNLERALQSARGEATLEGVVEGIDMIVRMFRGVLEKAGVRTIEPLGEEFDPNYHQAVQQVEDWDGRENVVVEVVQRGYLLDHRVLRPAMVKVSKAAAPVAGPAPSGPAPVERIPETS